MPRWLSPFMLCLAMLGACMHASGVTLWHHHHDDYHHCHGASSHDDHHHHDDDAPDDGENPHHCHLCVPLLTIPDLLSPWEFFPTYMASLPIVWSEYQADKPLLERVIPPLIA